MTQPGVYSGVQWINGSRAHQRGSASCPDLVCFSHLRWGFVFQRPQHLMTRFARDRRVFFIEEPIRDAETARVDIQHDASGVLVVVPHLPADLTPAQESSWMRLLVERLLLDANCREFVSWYLTPMALRFTRSLRPAVTVFDCMDELSAFAFAPPELLLLESELLGRADLVFTGGRSLYEAKRKRHPDVYCHPSSVDVDHFSSARGDLADPADQAGIPRPRLGYAGVIDERMDLGLIDAVASARPDWNIVLVGPVVKIDPASLPRRDNVHLLGGKAYAELPSYLAHWDVAMLPFARNEATRFISPTKTPEYLAAGRPVVSTSIHDVVTPYGDLGLAHIADEPDAFVAAVESALATDRPAWLGRVDQFLMGESWESTWGAMRDRIDALVTRRRAAVAPKGIRRVEPAPAQGDRRPVTHIHAPAHQAERS